MRRLGKYATLFVLLLIALVAAAVIFTQTPVFKGWLKDKAMSLAQPYVDGELSVGALKGNLFSYLVLEDLKLEQEDETVVSIEFLSLRYDLFGLLSKEIIVPELVLQQPTVKLRRDSDGGWNLAQLLDSDQNETPAEETQNASFDWHIQLPSLRLQSGSVVLSGLTKGVASPPTEIVDIELELGFLYRHDRLQVAVENLIFETTEPDSDQLGEQSTETPQVESSASVFKSELQLTSFDDPTVDFWLQAQPLALSEVRRMFPEFPLYGNPRLRLEANGPLNDLRSKLEMQIGSGTIELSGLLNIERAPYRYQLDGSVRNIDLAALTRNQALESDLNVTMEVDGSGTELGEAHATFIVNADSGYALGRSFEAIHLEGRVVGDSASVVGDLAALSSRASFRGNVVMSDRKPKYELHGNFRNLDLQKVIGDSALTTELNFNLDLNGRGVDFDSLTANVALDLFSSAVKDIPVDTARVELDVQDQLFDIKKAYLKSPFARFDMQGKVGLRQAGRLSVEAEFPDIRPLTETIGLDSLAGELSVRGELRGMVDSLVTDLDLALQRIRVPGAEIGALDGEFIGRFSESQTTFELQAKARDAEAFGNQNLESEFTIAYRDSIFHSEIEVRQEDRFSAHTAAVVDVVDNGYRVILEELSIDGFGEGWQKRGPKTEITYLGSELNIDQFVVVSDSQTVTLAGRLDTEGSSDLRLELASPNIAKLSKLIGWDAEIAGELRLEMSLTGTLSSPQLDGAFRISGVQYLQNTLHTFSGDVGYRENRFDGRFLVLETERDTLMQFGGFLPYQLSIAPFETKLLNSEQLEFRFQSAGVDVSFLQGFIDGIANLRGRLVADIILQNTLQDLLGVGPIRLVDGQIDLLELGIEYRDINLALLLKEKEVLVKELRIKSGGGDLKIIDGSLSLSKDNIEGFKVRLQANDFKVADSEKLAAVVGGQIEMLGSVQSIELSGDLALVEGEVYYPAWMSDDTAVEITSRPFFVVSDDTLQFKPSGAIRFQKTSVRTKTAFTETDFYKSIRARLSLTIDRNTWLRSEEANIEVQGELELQKSGTDIVLFGTVEAVRGYYELQGRRFEIVEGEIAFKGSPDFNPDLRIVAVYEFTDRSDGDHEDRQIRVEITGTKTAPEFLFTIDGQQAEQKDVLAILLFGKSFDELTISEGNTVSEQTSLGEQAQGFFTGQLMKQLSQRLGEELDLDVLQIESSEDLGDTKVRVGKYVTDDVFVSVTQDFGAQGEQKVKLEYKLPKKIVLLNLFLQALKERQDDTAVDVIWKYEW